MMKSQAAMEYLMTYGWAILVIAVVLAALYSLGIFNPNTFTPKASAGSCEVVRPFGPGTTTDISLEGTCTNMLPKYVASFNGGNSYIQPRQGVLGGTSSLTVSLWFDAKSLVSNGNQYGWIDQESRWGFKFGQPASVSFCFATPTASWAWCATPNSLYTFSPNKWYFIAFTYKNGTPTEFYSDGIQYQGPTETGTMATGLPNPLQIGPAISATNPNDALNGYIANVQIYNTSLSANQITALYQEGIGGAPIELTHLVGWWPLNGNTNDYSGNKNNGKEYNIGYSSTWYKTYFAP